MENKKTTTIRPPIVVVLGHIDHGKSSLLEAVRDFRITSKESGGITQHIGAYQIEEQGKKITFIDTPGHEAFSQMRSRGAKVADIAILVVDATEGVKPQTKEAISHIKKAEISTIVVLSKIDRPDVNPEKVKRELSQEDFLVESLGGKIPSVEVSAKTKKGIQDLLEIILLTAEMEGLKSDSRKPGEGVIIESHLDNLRGVTATLLLTDGHLNIGDVIATKSAFVKIKSIENFEKTNPRTAMPSDPIVIFGFNMPPGIGDEFRVFPDLKSAENYIKTFKTELLWNKSESGKEDLFFLTKEKSEAANRQKALKLILKTDVLGSKEAIEGILSSLPQEKISLKILKSEVGNINESDIKTANAGKIIILGFRVKMDSIAKKMAEREKVKIVMFDVIYDLIKKVEEAMEKLIEPEEVREDLGRLRVLVKFLAEKNRQIIGGKVVEGEAKKGSLIEVLRGEGSFEEKIGQGKMVNLQRNKKDAKLISKGEECGILFEGDVSIEKGDTLLFYERTYKKN